MTRIINILASVALAASLTPVAADATTTSLNHIQIMANKAVSQPLPIVQYVADNCDASQAQTPLDQTIVYSGATAQMFPDSIGG